MPQAQPDDPKSQRSVLEILGERSGLPPKVLLPDSNSEHGASPVVDPLTATTKLVPQGRGNYQLLGEIARGGMGVILKGHDTDLGRDVAVKVLDKELAKKPSVVQRFIEEAQIGGQLQHPGIVPVYELGLMADDSPYFTMKLVKGRTLAALFRERKQTSDNRGRLLAIFESVCQTVAYAHSKSVLHRDLKPANIMVGAFGEVQVVDWGLAKVLRRGGIADEKRARETVHTIIETVRSGPGSSGSDSMVGSVMGTPAYMAPEQAQGEIDELDERADVFSLGAILCELLTGTPPYVEIEGESILMQAARAKLGPARARIEASDADRALVQLCLTCLTPARATRPANAAEVASEIHTYLTSVEERAQKAEVAAVEARIKAAEERRARRLTLALAGTITTAVLLGGGGWYWMTRERERRTEEMRTAIETAHNETIELGRAGKSQEALASARRGLALAETGGADATLLERARSLVAHAESDVGAVERERELREQDVKLRDRLVDLRLQQIDALNNPKRETELDAAFAAAFHDYGVDLEGADLALAMERIQSRDIAEEVALALDDWGRLRRDVHGDRSEMAERLLYLAMDLDPEPGRLRLRKAVFDNDLATMLELASPTNLANLAPGSIWVLSATLWDRYPERRPDVYAMYDQAVHLYPGDFVLQSIGGNIYQLAGRFEAAMACRTAALSLRPEIPIARMRMAESVFFLGRVTDAAGAYRACIATNPANPDAHYGLALCLLQLGDYEGALASLERSLAIQNDPSWQSDALSVRYLLGRATRAELDRAIAAEVQPLALATYLYPLLDHPDPAQRDPEFVLRMMRERASSLASLSCRYVLETVAAIRMQDWPKALAALQNRFAPPTELIVTPHAFDFIRALVHSELGHDDAAHECYARAMAEWKTQTAGNPAAWERSDVMRWRREAEAAMKY